VTGHELARKLLELPDLEVWGRAVGQGSNEQGDDPLTDVRLGGEERNDILSHIYPAKPNVIDLIF